MSTATVNAGLPRSRAVAHRPAHAAVRRAASPRRPAPAVRRRPEVVALPPRTGRRQAAVRLTRRGRVVAVVMLLVLVFALLTVFGSHSAATGQSGTPVQTRTVEVAPGDTLWSIASDVAASGQTRDLVHQIEELNAMDGPGVTVGQRIAVPVG
jgi:LysM repeat protein